MAGREGQAVGAGFIDKLDDGLGEGFAIEDVGNGIGCGGAVGVEGVPAGDAVDGRQDAGEVGHPGPLGERDVRQGFQNPGEEVEQAGQDGGVGVGIGAVEFSFLAALVVGDELQLDGQQALGEVAGERASVDGGHGQDAAEFEDDHVVVGVQGAVDDAVAGDGPAQGVGEPVRDDRDVVEADGPGVERLHRPGLQVAGCGALGGAGGVDDADDHGGALGLAGALFAAEGEDRVGQVGDERGDEPGGQELKAFVVGVEQGAEPGEAVAVADGFGQGLHGAGAAEDDWGRAQALPAVGADGDAAAIGGAEVDDDAVVVAGDA
ncbi:hypothetical protein SMD11_5619 [Streptomyces albireticuli]|uniref:Uncharacterized protein n=1 Tax=Streptomyces albireticuli TaxID=1940 RepID=A0A1Z2LAF6_9ACTN|nr:hypothetical protein SMD11_5619 [Streptomyces albireticuli]